MTAVPGRVAPDAEARMAFILRLRARGVSDVAVLRALETVPRHLFVPHIYMDLAWRDVALPIACGQTMPEPYLVARVMEALQVAPVHRVLEIGTGSGYATAILARLASEVVSFERFRTVATEAAVRLDTLGVKNARIIHGDGLDPPGDIGAFDRVVIHGGIDALPEKIAALVAEFGIVIFARGGTMLRVADDKAAGWVESELFPWRGADLVSGASATF